jgi:exopolysaccharide biosynthesis polyprenyl glycosylphosphotransferase
VYKRSLNGTIGLIMCDLLLTEVALCFAQLARFYLPVGRVLSARYVILHPLVYGMVALIWLVLFSQLGVYQPWRKPLAEELLHLLMAAGFACFVLAGALYFSFRDVPRLLFFYFATLDIALLAGLRIGVEVGRRHRSGRSAIKRVLIVGAGAVGQDLAAHIQRDGHPDVEIVGFVDEGLRRPADSQLPVVGCLANISRCVSELQVGEVIFALPAEAHGQLVQAVTELQHLPVMVSVVPDVMDIAFPRTRVENVYNIPLIRLRDPAIDDQERVVKRLFDLGVATIALVLLSPLMALITLIIKLDSEGPALIRQTRIGENACPFKMYKFRSMVVDAEQRAQEVIQRTPEGQIIHKRRDDPRITRVGHVLRRYSLDELPQLWNVLRGEMSLVGPRPELPWLVDRYELWQWRRFAVPPGMTGWWQINGRSDQPMHMHVGDDLYYIQHHSLWLDCTILFKTIAVVLTGQGAY